MEAGAFYSSVMPDLFRHPPFRERCCVQTGGP